MLFPLLVILTCVSLPAQAVDRTEYKLIDLRAVSLRGGLHNYRLEKETEGRQRSVPQGYDAGYPSSSPDFSDSLPPQPVQGTPQQAQRSPAASAPAVKTAAAPASGAPAQTTEIEDYIKSNPQVIPDV